MMKALLSSGLFFFCTATLNGTTKELETPIQYKVWSPSQVQSLVSHLPSSIRWRICTSITCVKWRINRHFGVRRITGVGVKAGMCSSAGSLPRIHQSGEMMSLDSNYVKKVDTCKGAANWNQYTSPFITNRQLINDARALQLTRGSFTQLPARLDSRWSVALFKEHWLVRAGVNNWLFSRWSMHGDCKQVLYCAEPSVCAHWVQLCNRRRSDKVEPENRREPAAVTKNSNEAHVHIQMCEQLRFAFWLWASSQFGLFSVLRNLFEETTTHKTHQLSSPHFF